MPRALVIHYELDEAAVLAERIRRCGFDAVVYPVRGASALGRRVRESEPDVIVIDLMRLPSYGRAMGALLREQKGTRAIPLVFVQGEPEKTRLVRQLLPDAVFTTLTRLDESIRKALAAPPVEPVIPNPASIPAVHKLRIRDGSVVALLHAPPDFRNALHPLPKAVRFQTTTAESGIILLFVKSMAQLGREVPSLIPDIQARRILWVLWQKQASRAPSDVTMPRIMEFCTTLGLSIGKICAVDQTWSAIGICIPRRRR